MGHRLPSLAVYQITPLPSSWDSHQCSKLQPFWSPFETQKMKVTEMSQESAVWQFNWCSCKALCFYSSSFPLFSALMWYTSRAVISSWQLMIVTLSKIAGYVTHKMTPKVKTSSRSDQHMTFLGRNVKSKASYFLVVGFSSKKSNDKVGRPHSHLLSKYLCLLQI